MLKNIIFALLSFVALAASAALFAAELPPVVAAPVQAMPSSPDKDVVVQAKNNTRTNNDKLVDYRYCLELKTDRDIAECRYKK